MVNPAPTDPQRTSQWYLYNTTGPDLNVTGLWADYTGAGIRIAIVDDGFDTTHPDLAGRFNASLSHDFVDADSNITPAAGQYHGTAVAGILGAASNNTGIVGIAYDADLIGLRISFGADTGMFAAAFQRFRDVDIANNSWGYSEAFSDIFTASYFTAFKNALMDATQFGRNGLGTSIVFAAGNSAVSGDNTNYHNVQNSSYTITVAALDTHGNHGAFSNPGASILVSAPGVAVLTTDAHGAAGVVPGDYASGTGTSFATPMVSGVIALMLEANPGLGYRDVQEILAYAARKVGTGGDWQTNDAVNWNGGGLHYSHSYGFGMVDAHAAVRLAETWMGIPSTYANILNVSRANTAAITIPDNGTTTSTITIANDVIIDHVEITIDITHANASQLRIILIAPNGTQSILADHAPHTGEFPTFIFSTVASWGEHALGTWTLQISDTVTGTTGTLNSWTLTALGDAPTMNDTYIYTDENIGLIRPVDINGGIDTINAAAMTRAQTLILANNLENLFTGDGNDFVAGNALGNTISTGRGNDVIRASGGSDVINGGAGEDIYQSDDVFNHRVDISDTDITLTALSDGTITQLSNIETFQFAGISYDIPGLAAASRSGALTDVIYFVHGTAGIAQRHSQTNGDDAFTAQQLGVGGQGVVLLSERDSDHLTLTNNAGANLNAVSMRMDDGLHLTVRGFEEVTLVADGTHATSIDIAGGQRGLIQTGAGHDTIDFLAFLIDRTAPAQERTLTASTGTGNDRVSITDRSAYLAYDIDLGAGNDLLSVNGTQSGHILGGSGADTFKFSLHNGNLTGIYDFSVLEGDKIDLSMLVDGQNLTQNAISAFISLETANNNTVIRAGNAPVVTLYGTTLTNTVQHYIDSGVFITRED